MIPHPDKALIETVARAGRRLVAGGIDGLLIVSDDDGQTWRQIALPVSATLTAIRFVDDQFGWAVGHWGAVLRTEDGGLHWTLVETGPHAAQALIDAARAGNEADSVRARKIAAAEALLRTDPACPFLLIQTDGPGLVRLIGAGMLSDESTDRGRSWRPWTGGIGNPDGLRADGLAMRDGTMLVAGAHGMLLFGKPEDGLHPVASPFDGDFHGAVDAGAFGFVAFGQQGHALATTGLRPDWAPGHPIDWRRVSDPSQTTLTAGLVREDGVVLLADASGAVWQLAGRPESPRLDLLPAQADFPVLAMAETQDHALILAGSGGVVRIRPAPSAP